VARRGGSKSGNTCWVTSEFSIGARGRFWGNLPCNFRENFPKVAKKRWSTQSSRNLPCNFQENFLKVAFCLSVANVNLHLLVIDCAVEALNWSIRTSSTTSSPRRCVPSTVQHCTRASKFGGQRCSDLRQICRLSTCGNFPQVTPTGKNLPVQMSQMRQFKCTPGSTFWWAVA